MEKFHEISNSKESDHNYNDRKHAVSTLSESTNLATKMRRCYSKRKSSFTIKVKPQINGLDNVEYDNQLSVKEGGDGECLVIGLSSVSQPENSTIAIAKENEREESRIIFDDIPNPVDVPVVTGIRRRFADTSISCSSASAASKKRKFFCEVRNCSSSFLHRATYERHMKIHQTSSSLCKICFKMFENSAKLLEHQLQVHNGQGHRLYPCSHCDKSFHSEEYRNRHLERVKKGGSSLICIVCSKIFHNRDDLNFHMKHTHTEDRQFSCKECDMQFKRETHAIVHMKTHFSTDIYACNICNKEFKTLFLLNRHSKVHSSNKHNCNVCSAGFTYKTSLMKHLKQQHPKLQELSEIQKQMKGEQQVYDYKLSVNY